MGSQPTSEMQQLGVGMEVLAESGCISECLHKETIVSYTFRDPIDLDLVESLAEVGALFLNPETGIFKVVKVDHFYIFGLLGEHELRICMYYHDKISDRLIIDKQLVTYFKDQARKAGESEGNLSLEYNPTGSLAYVAGPNGGVGEVVRAT